MKRFKGFTLAEVLMPKRTSGIENKILYSRESEGQAPSNLNKKSAAFTLAEVLMPKRTSGIENKILYSRESEGQAPSNLNKKSAAFTLAEVLITLAIIGIVAALTIPNVIKNYQKHVTTAKLKEAYGTVSKILQTAEVERGSVASWYSENDIINNPTADRSDSVLNNFANTYMIPYLNVVDSGKKSYKEFGYKKFYAADGTPTDLETERMGMKLANGMFIWLTAGTHGPNSGVDNENTWITVVNIRVDIDGPEQGANRVGKDIFYFQKYITSDLHLSQLQPYMLFTPRYRSDDRYFYNIVPNSRTYLFNYCKSGGGSCAALIMTDGWQIKDDYPWF